MCMPDIDRLGHKFYSTFASVCSVLKEQVSKESNALSVSKEFLRKQRQSLKRRQAALQAAKQELTRDVLRQKQGVRILF